MGRAQKAKGATYENQLVTLLGREGYAAYRVPLSGALGHGKAGERLPESLRLALSGDVGCEIAPGRYLPFEVKYRQNAEGYRTLYNLFERYGFVPMQFQDCRVYPEAFVHDAVRDQVPPMQLARSVLTDVMRDWFVGSEVLALKARGEPWLFVRKKEHNDETD